MLYKCIFWLIFMLKRMILEGEHGIEFFYTPLDEPPGAVGALVRLVAAVDLPVAVKGAGVRQLLAADLARHGRLAGRVDGRQRVPVACNTKTSLIYIGSVKRLRSAFFNKKHRP
jgi:methylglyoxal synthase